MLLENAIGRNVAFVPGKAFFADGSGKNTVRLSYSLITEDAAEAGIRTLCSVIAEYIRECSRAAPKAA